MKLSKFSQFITESSGNLPPEVKLAKLGLSPGIRVFEWWTELKAEDPAFLTIFFIERYAWPESSEDDVIVETHFSMERSRDYIEERLMRFAQDHDMDWIHDMERDTWKRVNR